MKVTPLILTWNEEANIARVLDRLVWAETVIIVDSGSTDGTLNIAAAYKNVEVHTRKFDNHRDQWNFGLDLVRTDWVLAMDADYVLDDELISEIQKMEPAHEGYFCRFRYCVNGKPLSATILPPRPALFNKSKARYYQDGHTQALLMNSEFGFTKGKINHDDRKPAARWMQSQVKYARLEAAKLNSIAFKDLEVQDKIRKLIFFAPFAVILYCFLVKGLWKDGWRGALYTVQRFWAEILLSYFLIRKI